MTAVTFFWLIESRKKFHVKDFGYVFVRYNNN
nr:YvbH-like oligomerization domain-containing protein [Peribacillus cavernae]